MAGPRPSPATERSRWSRHVNAWSAVHIVLTAGLITGASFWVRGLELVAETPEWQSRATSTPQPAPPTPTSFQTDLPPQETVYIVGTEADADSLRVVLEDDGAVRFYFELRPLPDLVIVARTDEEAQAIIEVLLEGNRMRASMHQAEVRIVDLR